MNDKLQINDIPLEHLAHLNQDGDMTKLVAAPLAVIFGLVALIFVLRQLQRIKERVTLGRTYRE